MVFSSLTFLYIFLPVTLVIYYIVPKQLRNLFILISGLFFYAWGEPIYVFVLIASTMIDYFAGLVIYKAGDRQALRKLALVISMVMNLSLLGFFKYSNFIIENINNIFGTHYGSPTSLLPIGISFFTFQSMSYTIDLYQKNISVQKNPITFAAFVTLFPQIVAGPIVRYEDVAAELNERVIDIDLIWEGVLRFAVGLGKKVLIANNIGVVWTNVKAMDLSELPVATAWLGIAAYTLQIYFDFSGYSDMAIGLGAILGFHFPENFNYPYIATSVTDFWHRWHISLSTWFKEYVYIPLGGNRKGLARQILNILIVWTLTGIWHGAGWNFLFWGLWFALFLILEKLFLGELLKNAPVVFGRAYTLTVVLISWVFFALESPGEILAYLQAMFGMNGVGPVNSLAMFLSNEYLVLLVIALVACLPLGSRLVHALKSSKTGPAMALYRLGEKVIPAVLLLLSVAYIVDASYNPFLYFRF